MDIFLAIGLFIAGLVTVIYFAEKLVGATVRLSGSFGVSAFLISVIFIGFDPENLFVGAAGSYEGVYGIAAGSIIGAAMVAMAFALGVTALITPVKFKQVSKRIMILPVLAVLLFGVLSLDKVLSRLDGIILLAAYAVTVMLLIRLSRKGIKISPEGEVEETLKKTDDTKRWKSVLLFGGSLVAIVIGSEVLVESAKSIIETFNITDTLFGMTILAFLVSVEELARELPAALKGRPEISLGNVVGSVFAFFLFNAGIIAVIEPVNISRETLQIYLPISVFTIILISFLIIINKQINRFAAVILILLYVVFIAVGYF